MLEFQSAWQLKPIKEVITRLKQTKLNSFCLPLLHRPVMTWHVSNFVQLHFLEQFSPKKPFKHSAKNNMGVGIVGIWELHNICKLSPWYIRAVSSIIYRDISAAPGCYCAVKPKAADNKKNSYLLHGAIIKELLSNLTEKKKKKMLKERILKVKMII